MSLIRFEDISFEIGEQKILSDANLAIEAGERLCLIGRNGAGKSTTFKLIMGLIEPDRGSVIFESKLIISQLEQSLPISEKTTVRDIIRSGLSEIELLLRNYHELASKKLEGKNLLELEDLHKQIDTHGGWNLEQRIDTIISELNLPAEKRMDELSGGWLRRVSLGKALVQKPDILLLDEPTNHLDISTIKWLEDIVYSYKGTVIFITHDRAFIKKLASRILEIDRGKITSWPGDYNNYLRRKEKFLIDEKSEYAKFDKKLEQEEIWIRQGIKARRTRNEGRSRALMRMREERQKRVVHETQARIHIGESEKSGRKVIRIKNINYQYTDEPLINNFSLNIQRGDRIGIVGNNGIGKTTLLRLLLGKIEPNSGTVKLGTNIEIGYFDQLRQKLDPERSVADNVSDGKTHIKINGNDRHVVGYLKGFLFSPKRSMTPVKALSGGEKNRIILAKLFTKATNLLILDEPTNDLDMETLDVLEEQLVQYKGTLLVVSHDREFLDNVITSMLVFEDQDKLNHYVGNFSDWLARNQLLTQVDHHKNSNKKHQKSPERTKKIAKLSFKEQRILNALPDQIKSLEINKVHLEGKLSSSDFYNQDKNKIQSTLEEFTELTNRIEEKIEAWSILTEKEDEYKKTKDPY
ncbi:MAG: ATP-binding cassette subfamily F protein uup [Woeseiaceae bacterium]|jgi:ATP-binding cassette subfamily F protein uup|tara:strand:- start:462 stop:2372 length:1911 start_codon:yes stop_codon:yes gene_type:complete